MKARAEMLLLAITGAMLVSCGGRPSDQTTETFTVQRQSMPFYRYCAGKLTIRNAREFKADRKGSLRYAIPADAHIDGDSGAPIAVIEPAADDVRSARIDIRNQTKELSLMHKQVALEEQLFSKGQIPLNELERLRIDLARKEQDIEKTTEKLRPSVIRAPFKGRIGVRTVADGAEVNEGSALFTWVDWRSVGVDMYVPDYQLRHVRPGDSVLIDGGGLRRSISGVVRSIAASIPNSQSPGMLPGLSEQSTAVAHVMIDSSCMGSVIVPSGNVVCRCSDTLVHGSLVVPVSFLYFKGNDPYCMNASAVLSKVSLGVVGDSMAEVTGGLVEGSTIVMKHSSADGRI